MGVAPLRLKGIRTLVNGFTAMVVKR
jgi:hypothetical protein